MRVDREPSTIDLLRRPQTIRQSAGGIPRRKLVAVERWHTVGDVDEPALLNGWYYDPAPDTEWPAVGLIYPCRPGYFLDTVGQVHLRGVVRRDPTGGASVNQNSGIPILQLPLGYRPDRSEEPAAAGIKRTGGQMIWLRIATNGDVFPFIPTDSYSANLYACLDGVIFRAA